MHICDVLYFVCAPFFLFMTCRILLYEEKIKFVDERSLTYVGHIKRQTHHTKHVV